MSKGDNTKQNWFARHKVLSVIIGVIILFIIIGVASSSGNNNDQSTADTSSPKKSETTKPKPEKPKTWTKVATLSGSADKSSETIKLSGGKTRLKYTFTGSDPIVGSIYVLDEGTDLNKDGGIPDVTVSKAGSDQTILRKSAGDYYVHVAVANATYTVTLEELK